jgi:formylglycine-generating enzyme required for sulfatase activity
MGGGLPADLRLLSANIASGFFLDEAQFRAMRAEGFYPRRVGRALTIDTHGIRIEVELAGVAHVFRWIWPGRFLMGSPPEERGRYENEVQYEVILTRGFWLAETACTQPLWQTVMGDNPSLSKGGSRPVKNLSWNNVQEFIARLKEAIPGLGARLPTEAEWEYACRANTVTAYSFGDDFDPTLANNGDATVQVRSLPSNPWDLYEMHGNVWEWCQDWYGEHPAGPVVDPEGPEQGAWRVLRGGGWIADGRRLRSAYRDHVDPGSRNHDFGFRLARGPEPGQAGQAGGERGRTVRAGSERAP